MANGLTSNGIILNESNGIYVSGAPAHVYEFGSGSGGSGSSFSLSKTNRTILGTIIATSTSRSGFKRRVS